MDNFKKLKILKNIYDLDGYYSAYNNHEIQFICFNKISDTIEILNNKDIYTITRFSTIDPLTTDEINDILFLLNNLNDLSKPIHTFVKEEALKIILSDIECFSLYKKQIYDISYIIKYNTDSTIKSFLRYFYDLSINYTQIKAIKNHYDIPFIISLLDNSIYCNIKVSDYLDLLENTFTEIKIINE